MEKLLYDSGLSTVALSSPIWLQWVESSFGLGMLIGGVVLLTLRIIISWREYKKGKETDGWKT